MWQVLKRLTLPVSYDAAILLLGIYPRKPKTWVHAKLFRGTEARMVTAALSVITPNVLQQVNGSGNGSIRTTDYYSTTQRTKLWTHTHTAWVELKAITLSEKRHSQMTSYCVPPFPKRQH